MSSVTCVRGMCGAIVALGSECRVCVVCGMRVLSGAFGVCGSFGECGASGRCGACGMCGVRVARVTCVGAWRIVTCVANRDARGLRDVRGV